MSSLSRCSRAWLSFLLLQDVGVIWMCCSGQASLLFKNATASVARQYSLVVAVICVVRLFLLRFFESFPLHACHITVTTLYALAMGAEMFYYRTMDSTTPNIVRVVVQAVTVILFTIAQRWLYELPQAGPVRRKGRLFAKHYMEGDLLIPPESDDVRELRKKQL
ncbi:hypothetical protein ANCCAN_14059 [Ancylostoma caninum]|uniref:Uncharacterized protein n=1 Tax=Ancylostoma caninum TaxID=29170 RepID=A0A368GB71_ANCCA|nr:hypothetical protein ANCCAN_14059 [Ancylostoma caninum]